MTNAEAWFNKSLRPRKPEGSLGRTAQDGHLDSHTAPELCRDNIYIYIYSAGLTIADDTVTAIFPQESGGTLNNISNIIDSNNNNGKLFYSANLSAE